MITLRKKAGWTQEEFANQLNVSRQSVSKWEGEQSIPDVDKLIQISEIFGVSIDYLLKGDVDELKASATIDEDIRDTRWISLEEANSFLEKAASAGGKIALGVFLCILSPILLLLSSANEEARWLAIPANLTVAISLVVLIGMVAVAVGLFITGGKQIEAYEFLEKDFFETKYGVTEMVSARKKAYEGTHTRLLVIGITSCILAVLPVIVGSILQESEAGIVIGVVLTLILAAIGVYVIVETSIKWGSYEQLLQEGEYSRVKKESRGFLEPIAGIYWLVVVAGYLAYSFITDDWYRSWIIYPVAGVLFGAIAIISEIVSKQKNK